MGTYAVLQFFKKHTSKIVDAGSGIKYEDGGLDRCQSSFRLSEAPNTEVVKNIGDWFGVHYATVYYSTFTKRVRLLPEDTPH